MLPLLERQRRVRSLIQELEGQGITDPRVLRAIEEVPREFFVPDELESQAYENFALGIGLGQTISQPYIVALMTQAAELTPGSRVLEIGTGSGYQGAILARLCTSVESIERLPELAELAARRWRQLGITNARGHVGDGTLGWPEGAPYDAILVTANAPSAPPALLGQLAPGGRLICPVGESDVQALMCYRKNGEDFPSTQLCECRFVPLIGQQGWSAESN